MSKMGSHYPFEYLWHKLWSKEGPGVKLLIWLPTIKSWESPWFTCAQGACHIPLENFWQGLQLFFKVCVNQRLHKKLWISKVMKVPISRIARLSFWESQEKCHLVVAPIVNIIRGKVVAYPKVWAMVNLLSLCMHVAYPCIKNVLIMH